MIVGLFSQNLDLIELLVHSLNLVRFAPKVHVYQSGRRKNFHELNKGDPTWQFTMMWSAQSQEAVIAYFHDVANHF